MKITFIKMFDKKNDKCRSKNANHETGLLKTIVKKNQIALFAIALMLIASGYLNYTNNLKVKEASLGDATLVSANIIEENIINQEKISSINNIEEKNEIKEEIINEIEDKEYFSKIKLDRDTMYSQMIESYQKILEDSNIQDEQKKISSEEIRNINNRKNSILTIENLIKAKGIKDVAVLINDQIIDVVVKKSENLTDEEVAQISNIVSRELNTDIENIHITRT